MKTKRYWLRGGVVGLIFGLFYLAVGGVVLSYIFAGLVLYSAGICYLQVCPRWVDYIVNQNFMYIFSFVVPIIIGVVVGLIYGKIKNRHKIS